MLLIVYFASNDEGQARSDFSDLTRFNPSKLPPKKGKLVRLAYEEAARHFK